MTWQVAALWGATPCAVVGVYSCFRGSCSFHSQDRFRGDLSVTVMGAAVSLNQATWRSIPEDISPQISSSFQFWGHLAIMNLSICVVEIYNWESGGTYAHACVCVAAVLSVDSKPLEGQFYLFVPVRSHLWMQFLIRQWSAAGIVGLDFTGRLEFTNKKKKIGLWLYCFLL
jgi:hypothetical protein